MTDAMQLRKIDLAGRDPLTPLAGPGPEPRLDWLPIGRLVVDETYQRPIAKDGWARIKRIAEQFRWAHFAPVIAAPIDGGGGLHALIDGQHRVHAARMAGHDMVPAMIVSIEPRAQATAFSAINGEITNMTLYHVYRAALAAEEDWAIRCRDVVEAAGCRLMTYGKGTNQRHAREIYCISIVRTHVLAGRADVIRKGLLAICDGVRGGAGPEHFLPKLLGAWWSALALDTRFLDLDLVDFMSRHDLVSIHDRAARISRQPEYRDQSLHKLIRSSIVALLKHDLKADVASTVVGAECTGVKGAFSRDGSASQEDVGAAMAELARRESRAMATGRR